MTISEKKENLNGGCPFGFLSTKHYSAEAHAPSIKEAKIANTIIRKILDEFVESLKAYGSQWQRVPIESFDVIARNSSTIHSNTPASIKAIYPISKTRSAEHILSQLQTSDEPLVHSILKMHYIVHQNMCSHRKSALRILEELRSSLENQPSLCDHHKFVETLVLDIQAFEAESLIEKQGKNADESLGTIVSETLQDELTAYQNIQEKFESSEQINAVNEFLERRLDLIEDILGIQQALCLCVQDLVKKNPEMLKYTRAFSEIVLFPVDGAFNFFPSSRFLKVILHNWGGYFLEAKNKSNAEILRHSIHRALQDGVYLQNIFIFRKNDDNIRLHGIKPIICPAREAVGKMVSHYIPVLNTVNT